MTNRWLTIVVLLTASLAKVHADDWPQWLGPQRDSTWRETGIIKQFPAGGPKVRWRAPVAGGYSGPAVAGGKVFLTDYQRKEGDPKADPGVVNTLQGTERLLCFDAATGKLLWKREHETPYRISYPAGPRSTPTVDGDRVYALGAEGMLVCCNVHTGNVLWHKSLNEDFNTKTPYWGYSSHPLIDGDQLILVVGGAGSVVVSFNKTTGDVKWKSLTAKEAGYGSAMIYDVVGRRQLFVWHPQSVNALDPATGKVLWTRELEPDYSMSINAPIYANDYLFVGGIVNKSMLLQLTNNPPAAKEVWRGANKVGIGPVHAPPIIVGDIMYGVDREGELTAVELKTGKLLWQTYKPTTGNRRANSGTGFLVKHDDRYFIFAETGELVIAKLSPASYEEIGRASLVKPTQNAFGRNVIWSHPAYANQSVYVRNDEELVSYSLAD